MSLVMDGAPANAVQARGVWLPKDEHHLKEMIELHSKIGDIDGKGTYQLHKLRKALALVPAERRRVAIDIGAHIGTWSMHLVKEFDWLQAFEPIPAHRAIYPYNVPMDTVTLHPTALGNRVGTVELHWDPCHTGNTHRNVELWSAGVPLPAQPGRPSPEIITAPIRPLDDFGFTEVDFIKIDVEGVEMEVVEGARETIVENRPWMVVEQKGNDAKYYGQRRNEASAFLCGLGMKVYENISGDHIMGWG